MNLWKRSSLSLQWLPEEKKGQLGEIMQGHRKELVDNVLVAEVTWSSEASC